VLALLADVRQDVLHELLPKLEAVAHPSWEVHAQLSRLAAGLLCHGPPADVEERCLRLLSKALGCGVAPAQVIAISGATKVISVFPSLVHPFVDALVELPLDLRGSLLAQSTEPIAITLAGGSSLEAAPIGSILSLLSPLVVAEVLMESARAKGLDALEVAHAEIIATLLPPDTNPASLGSGWGNWLKTNKDYLYVALCHDELCTLITGALSALFGVLKEEAVLTFSTLLSSLKMLTEHSSDYCQRNAIAFLLSLLERGPPFTDAIHKLVENFDSPTREVLQPLVTRVEAV
jgi:hypothetical protein